MPITMSDTEKMSQVSTSPTGSPRDLSTAALVKEIGAEVSHLAHKQLKLAMTEVKADLKREAAAAAASDGQPAASQEYDIEVIRDHLANLLGELGVRRDERPPSHILRRLPIPFLLLGLGAQAKKIATAVAVTTAGMATRRFLRRCLVQCTHAHTERMGSRSGRLNSDQTARASKRA
jgi:hypothetical protein